MKAINLRQKKSGNFELCSKENATHVFKTKKSFIDFYSKLGRNRIIKTTYRLSQTYFSNANEVLISIGELPVKIVATRKIESVHYASNSIYP
jgi:hypothetical protein